MDAIKEALKRKMDKMKEGKTDAADSDFDKSGSDLSPPIGKEAGEDSKDDSPNAADMSDGDSDQADNIKKILGGQTDAPKTPPKGMHQMAQAGMREKLASIMKNKKG